MATMPRMKPVYAPVQVPPGMEVTRFVYNKRLDMSLPVVKRPITTVTKRVPVLDADGNQIRRGINKEGAPRVPVYRNVEETVYEEQILMPEPNGNVRWQAIFEPTKEEVAARERREEIARVQATLAEAIVNAGLTPEELVRRIAGAPAIKPDPEMDGFDLGAETVTDAVVPEVYELKMTSPGRWAMPNGEPDFRGTRKEAEKHLAELNADEGTG